jgi:hypothetical protein
MALEILAYLVQHPRAQDTFEGILEWWVLERYIERQRLAVEGAMEELVGSGLVLAQEGRDRRERYRLNPRRRREARALVERYEAARPGGA